jgi:hypothetical protein
MSKLSSFRTAFREIMLCVTYVVVKRLAGHVEYVVPNAIAPANSFASPNEVTGSSKLDLGVRSVFFRGVRSRIEQCVGFGVRFVPGQARP